MVRWFELRRNVRDALHGMFFLRYEKQLRNEALELNDLFLLMCYMEIVGLPNPAALYLLEIYPHLLEEFHLWHRRMGMDRSPLANLSCC
jgi:hypothetical protein